MLKVICSLTLVSCDKGVYDFLENTNGQFSLVPRCLEKNT